MHRPLRVPFYLRVWNLIKGVLFYNTVYWQRASDGLNMPKLTREEREKSRPTANLEIIKPREKPRARLNTFRGAQVSKPFQEPQVSEPHLVGAPEPDPSPDQEVTDEDVPAEDAVYVKRRKYKRRRVVGANGGNGFFRRVFGK